MATSAERQRKFRKEMEAAGFVQVTGWVPKSQASDVMDVMRRLRENPHLEVGVLKDPVTGRFVRK